MAKDFSVNQYVKFPRNFLWIPPSEKSREASLIERECSDRLNFIQAETINFFNLKGLWMEPNFWTIVHAGILMAPEMLTDKDDKKVRKWVANSNNDLQTEFLPGQAVIQCLFLHGSYVNIAS